MVFIQECLKLRKRKDRAYLIDLDEYESIGTNWITLYVYVNSIQDGLFWGCSRMGGVFFCPLPLPKICHTYPTMTKLGTVISYLRKIQKIYKSRDTYLEFC